MERGQQEFDTISRVIKKELERWDEVRLTELRATILRYLEEHMKHQAQVCDNRPYCRALELNLDTILRYVQVHMKLPGTGMQEPALLWGVKRSI